MSGLSQHGMWTCDQGAIRMTSTGQPSIFDMIKVLGGQKNPRDAWQRLAESHPEVVGKCDNLRFPTAERIAAGQLRRSTVGGNAGVERLVRKSAEYTRRLLDGEVDIPGV